MISTKNIISSLSDISEEFIFENYLALTEKLIGQEVVIKSVFNPAERTPSMTVYYDAAKRRYRFKCFSTAKGGTAFDLVQQMNPTLSKGEVAAMLIRTYKEYLKGNPVETAREYKQFGKYKVDGHVMRNWNNVDKAFWTLGNIDKKLLERFNAAPLQSFSMTKVENGTSKTIHISRDKIYGFFTKQGELFRIYQPGTAAKYIKVFPHTQGKDQLKYDVSTLILLSGMKDGLSFTSLEIPDTEFVAGDSENTMIPDAEMKGYLEKYPRVLVCFDEDDAGKQAMERYVEKYSKVKPIYTNFGVKDIFDAVDKYKREKVKETMITLLK